MDSIDFNEMSWVSWMTPVDDAPNRETWLMEAVDRLARSTFPAFKPPKWRVTCGWPKGVRGGKHAIGQCWPPTASADGTHELFISPELDSPSEVLHVLCHEMAHAIVGCDQGHKGEFVALCKKIGLAKPWTATTPGPELAATLAIYALQLGPYPHARLNDLRQRQSTRMLKASCPNPDCALRLNVAGNKPYTVRITQQWADAGMPSCPCGTLMMLDSASDEALREAA